MHLLILARSQLSSADPAIVRPTTNIHIYIDYVLCELFILKTSRSIPSKRYLQWTYTLVITRLILSGTEISKLIITPGYVATIVFMHGLDHSYLVL